MQVTAMLRKHVGQCVRLLAMPYPCTRSFSLSGQLHDSKKTHYEVLGLTLSASQDDVRSAFIKLSKEIHPDANPDDPLNHAKFVRVNEAYSVLSKLPSRRQYDVSLAYKLKMHRSSVSHTTGNSAAPGSSHHPNYDAGDRQSASEFWDETIWEMRDRSKDAKAFYSDDSYYGIKGIQRQSNGVIAAMVILFVIFGGGSYFYVALKYSGKKQRESNELVSAKNSRILKEIEEQARINGTAKQIELLQERIAAAEKRRQTALSSLIK